MLPGNFTNPNIIYPSPYNAIQIQIQQSCLNEYKNNYDTRLMYQMSHEVIHALMPTQRGNANYLEEGLAVSFSHRFLRLHAKKNLDLMLKSILKQGNENYLKAFNLVNKTGMANPIKMRKIREIEPYLSKININNLIDNFNIKENDAIQLLDRFI